LVVAADFLGAAGWVALDLDAVDFALFASAAKR
jgi:hypothetical protein